MAHSPGTETTAPGGRHARRARIASSRNLYLLLLLYVLASLTYFAPNVVELFDGYLNISGYAREPFSVDFRRLTVVSVQPEASAAGLAKGDLLESLNGEPYGGRSHWASSVTHVPADTLVEVGVRQADGTRETALVRLALNTSTTSLPLVLVFVFVGLLPPLTFLLVGYWVVMARPHDVNAWRVLVIVSFPSVLFRINTETWSGLWLVLLSVWLPTLLAAAPLALLWFGFSFPERARLDKRLPWLKWVLLIVLVIDFIATLLANYAVNFHPSWNAWTVPLGSQIANLTLPAVLLCFLLFAVATLDKLRLASSPDARRRMAVLCIGSITP